MNTKTIISLTVGTLLVLAQTFPSQANRLCEGQNSTLDCLKNNFEILYSTNYPLFWEIMKLAEKKATSCRSIPETAAFLELVQCNKTNAEVSEYLSEVIENLLLTQPDCFFDSVSIQKIETIRDIILRLRSPVFIEKAKIDKIFEKYRNNQKYKYSIEIYFKNQ